MCCIRTICTSRLETLFLRENRILVWDSRRHEGFLKDLITKSMLELAPIPEGLRASYDLDAVPSNPLKSFHFKKIQSTHRPAGNGSPSIRPDSSSFLGVPVRRSVAASFKLGARVGTQTARRLPGSPGAGYSIQTPFLYGLLELNYDFLLFH